MRRFFAFLFVFVVLVPGAALAWKDRGPAPRASRAKGKRTKQHAPLFDAAVVNDGAQASPITSRSAGSAVLRAQILLDRANFSVGEINGKVTENMRRAVRAYQQANEMNADGSVGATTWTALNHDTEAALVPYTITAKDVAGPFAPTPKEMVEQAKLKALGYQSPLEMFGERFHSSPGLLTALNPGKDFSKEGEEVTVPNVTTKATLPKVSKVQLSRQTGTLLAMMQDGKVVAAFPASMGSQHDPLPVGTWKVQGVARNPVFHYNPELFWDANPADTKSTIPPGPNNPVGVVWIDLSKEHYGIHGTPEPSHIGQTQSHGCIRLTNWDAEKLAHMVSSNVQAIFTE